MEAAVPEDVLACLFLDTADIQKAGWMRPPGAREIRYEVREQRVDRSLVTTSSRRQEQRPTVARFALASDTVQADTRPRLTQVLHVAETTRKALMSRARDDDGTTSPLFSGKSADGEPLQNHRHAYYIPCDDDNDGRIDHLVVYAREGFGERERNALMLVRKLWQHRNAPDLFPVLLGLGDPADFDAGGGPRATSCLDSARIWISRTPYLAARHSKSNGKDSIDEQVRRELASIGLPEPVFVSLANRGTATDRKLIRWSEFARVRKRGGGRPATTRGYGVRIEFSVKVRGPIALGYGAHFGLGSFVPEPTVSA
ncbi:MAG: type I-U CRISPR-associated protein Csb2 [Candidatus Krumholzibacteriia bacterium]